MLMLTKEEEEEFLFNCKNAYLVYRVSTPAKRMTSEKSDYKDVTTGYPTSSTDDYSTTAVQHHEVTYTPDDAAYSSTSQIESTTSAPYTTHSDHHKGDDVTYTPSTTAYTSSTLSTTTLSSTTSYTTNPMLGQYSNEA